MVRVLSGVAIAAALSAAGCGSDDPSISQPGRPTAGSDAVEVVAEDIRFSETSFRARSGALTISYRNEGRIEHTLAIEGVDGFMLDVPAHGDSDQGFLALEAGNYTIYCDVPGHRQAGMEATLEVS
jgi:plastocyanin